jgi:hypothetical protein
MTSISTTPITTLIERLKKELDLFTEKHEVLPMRKLEKVQKWSGLREQDGLGRETKMAVSFLKDVENCISPELRFLCELNDPPVRIIGKCNEDDVPVLRKWWREIICPQGLKETCDLREKGKLPLPTPKAKQTLSRDKNSGPYVAIHNT